MGKRMRNEIRLGEDHLGRARLRRNRQAPQMYDAEGIIVIGNSFRIVAQRFLGRFGCGDDLRGFGGEKP